MIHFLLSSDEVYKFMYNDVRKIPNVLTSERRRKRMNKKWIASVASICLLASSFTTVMAEGMKPAPTRKSPAACTTA